MESERFDLVFSGELVRGAELAPSKIHIGQLFKISADKVDALFSGEPVVLKKNLDFATATKYRVAIKKAGCRVDIIECERSAPVAEQKKPENLESTSPKIEPAAAVLVSSNEQVAVSQPEPKTPVIDVPDFGIAPAGVELLSAEEKTPVIEATVDTSRLSVRIPDGDLLDVDEKETVATVNIDTQGLSVAPVGEDVLHADEKAHVAPVSVDVSHVTIAPVGADLEQVKEEKDVALPDISALNLVDGH